MSQKQDDMINSVKAIIREYGGLKLTVRQIYYRLVAAQKLVNKLSSYQYLVKLLAQARRDGLVNYTDIEDRTRAIHFPDGANEWTISGWFKAYYEQMRNIDTRYDMPRWWGQPNRVIVMVEKQALSSLFEAVTDEAEVNLVVNRGYPSLTLMYELARSASRTNENYLLYFGDYDPSGLDIERSVEETLARDFGIDLNIERIAITRDQIDEYDIPPAPAKTADPRFARMEAETGEAMQVELDAIEPNTLQELIRDKIEEYFDEEIYDTDRDDELEKRRKELTDWKESALNMEWKYPWERK